MSEASIKKRPISARSIVTELSGSGILNPTPADSEESEPMMVELCLSQEKLKILSGSDSLQEVTSLEMCVDTRQDTLGNFGVYLPKLAQLKMNNSLILSLRDLGTSLSHLQVLWLARCGLTDLEGIASFVSLKELYVPYNNISDLSPLGILEHLELLDLEGNNIDDLSQLWYLGHFAKLRTLSLEGNPVCTSRSPGTSEVKEEVDYSYRSAVCEFIPQLRYLDDIPADKDKPQSCRTPLEDWTLLKESIKDCSINNSLEQTDTEERSISVRGIRPSSAWLLSLRSSSSSLSSRSGSARPLTSCTGSRPGSTDSKLAILEHEASDLTNGVGSFLCGNPLQAARARRQKLKLQNSRSQTRPSTRLSSYIPEHMYDHEESSSQDRSVVFAELRSWRIEHDKRLLSIEKDRQPQVMKILHSDDDDDEGSYNHSFGSDDNTRGEEEEQERTDRDTTSPDSSFQSTSPDQYHQMSESPEIFGLSSSSDSTMSPSPPPNAVAPPCGRRVAPIRARRLRPHNNTEIYMPRPSDETHVTDSRPIQTNLGPQSTMIVKFQLVSPQILHKPQRPSTSSVVTPHRAQWSEATVNHRQSHNQHTPIILSNTSTKLLPTRPQTARAALQRLPDRARLPARRNAHME
ncbi:leucine-rich repeat-containing protein 56-like [Myxocyprinus asiaticus]|uniref:leucine-rich repeat-containing protein 56-like n=1 Tax=Myxocyprinus asiaticus TaxID=70543 RepID=UPI002221F47D|nr:leucine-rich repeat-containing protein 56-like [Myxocyprinus asiaticus]